MRSSAKATVFLAQAGLIAALYTVLSLILQPLSYGPIQLRVSEALSILPVFTSAAVPGLTVGCLLTNLFGLTTGANLAGAWDVLFGTAATLLAALFTRAFRKQTIGTLPVLSTVPPVLINAVVIGLELTLTQFAVFSVGLFAFNALTVALGQFAACTVFGLLLHATLRRFNLPWA